MNDTPPDSSSTSIEELPEQVPATKLELQTRVEALLFAAPEALSVSELVELLADPRVRFTDIKRAICAITEEFLARPHGAFLLAKLNDGSYQFRTKESLAPILAPVFVKKSRPLSRAAQEVLGIIAYRQPVSRADIEFIRGVDSGSIINNLVERELATCTGRREAPGKPMLFGTTNMFLKVYNLKSLQDLPKIESFQPDRELLKDANQRIKNAAEAPPPEDTETFEIGKN